MPEQEVRFRQLGLADRVRRKRQQKSWFPNKQNQIRAFAMPAQKVSAIASNRRLEPGRRIDWPALAGGVVLAAAAILAYGRTFTVPLLFDDDPSIASNPTIRHISTSFWPPVGMTVNGRPILNLSLAINYSISGTAVWSYHAANLAIHVLAGLTLFGIFRHALVSRAVPAASRIAFLIALLWVLHPLLTESVTYLIQRAESLMGLFYLLTLFCFIRGAEIDGAKRFPWYLLSVSACLLGMATKEVMVSAPIVVLLYDRTFLAGSFREAWRRRWRVYAGLATTWLILPLLVLSSNGRSGSAGFGSGVSWWSYLLTQFPAIVHYLRLCFWPQPLVFDYGSGLAPRTLWIVPYALFITSLMAASAWALVERPALGFLGASFFLTLGPSSSFVPVATQTMAEHRMYLPLIPVVVLVVVGICRWLGRGALPLCVVLAAGLFGATWERNETYRSAVGIWSDTVAKRPDNVRAHINLGFALRTIPGRLNDAMLQYEEALRLKPDSVEAHYNLGNALNSLGRMPEAIAQYQEALRLKPDIVAVHCNLGNALFSVGRKSEAIAHYEEALRLKPDFFEAHFNMGHALNDLGQTPEAIVQYEEALRLRPNIVEAHCTLGNALNSLGRTLEAVAQFEEALRLRPDDATILYDLSLALLKIPGRTNEAVTHLKEVVRLQPNNDLARQILSRIDPLRQ